MANSKYEYVRAFERNDSLLPNCHLVVRIDGHSFHRFTTTHDFHKPNDGRGLSLMNHAARSVMERFNDVTLAYGSSDEFSFLLRPRYSLYERRESKLITTIVSIFTGAYIMHWSTYFPDTKLKYAPSFDGRVILYPTLQNVRDYFAWRQADAHINNLYNTTFWALQHMGLPESSPALSADAKPELTKLSAQGAEERLRGTLARDKNEILWRLGINYNNEDEMHKKGSILVYDERDAGESTGTTKKSRTKMTVTTVHVDLIQDAFWQRYPNILQP